MAGVRREQLGHAARAGADIKELAKRGVAIAMMNPKVTIGICLGLAALCGIAALWGFANASSRELGQAPVIAAVAGIIIGLGALILAAIVFFRVRVTKS